MKDLLKDNAAVLGLLRTAIKSRYPVSAIQKQMSVRVKEDTGLSTSEQNFLRNRLGKVEKVLKEEFEIDKPLRLAFCCSGGGNRAMVGTLGLLKAAARYKFLDASVYLTGLSGSTWMIAPWAYMYLKGMLPKQSEQSIEALIESTASELDYTCKIPLGGNKCGPPVVASKEAQTVITDNFSKRFAYQQPVSLINVYGPLVGSYALAPVKENKLNVTWSEISQEVQGGDIPLPLCSCCFDPSSQVQELRSGYAQEYEWMETGPFEAGGSTIGYVPVWALGSVFENGAVVQNTPEYPISFLLGIYGSAFALSVNDLVYHGVNANPTYTVAGQKIEVPIISWISETIDKANKDARAHRSGVNHAHVANIAKGLSSSAVANKEELALLDGGVYFNLPLPLLYDRPERAVDVVVMYDSNPGDARTLIEASRYFARKKVAMPNMEHVTKQSLISRPMTVFNDPRDSRYNKSMPTLVYIPTPSRDITKPPYNIDTTLHYPYVTKIIDNTKAPYTTLNFRYSKEDVYNLTQTMEAVFESLKDQITDVMQLVAKKKKRN